MYSSRVKIFQIDILQQDRERAQITNLVLSRVYYIVAKKSKFLPDTLTEVVNFNNDLFEGSRDHKSKIAK